MPSPHPTNRPSDGPTAKQLRYLRALAESRGQTFTAPRTKQQASAEIRRLIQAPEENRVQRAIERDRLERDVELPADTRIREDETTGYGAHAHWTHTAPREDPS